MTIPFWCLFIVLALPYVMVVMAGRYRKEEFGHADNNHPRIQASQLTGKGARIYAAHLNALEARVLFASAVIVAHIAGADPTQSIYACLLFVACRILHPILYINDMATPRSIIFGISMAAAVWLFVLAAMAPAGS